MRYPRRPAALVATAAISLALLTGCAAANWADPHPAPTLVGAVGSGFMPPVTPTPEATVEPESGSWEKTSPSPGYRVVLLTAGRDAPARALAAAVQAWAKGHQVDLRTVRADGDHVAGIVRAVGMKPDLIISAGNDLIDALTVVSASQLHQQFLIVGAEVAEPTGNVTAVDWAGASFRGEGLGASSTFDPKSFTRARCADAVRAGVAAVLLEHRGIVLWLD